MNNREDAVVDNTTTTVQTTVGDLIEALTSVAEQAGSTQEECYRIASFAIERILREKKQRELLS
jgi:hypothetical protein